MNHVWVKLEWAQMSFLQPLEPLCDGRLEAFLPATEVNQVRRTSADGTWLLRAKHGQQEVAIFWSDFRVNGASFGGEVARRAVAFLRECQQHKLPLILVMNSLGYRFMEGRAGFNDVFNLIPALEYYAQQQLVISICHGQCLGLGAILFGLGHYRIGVRQESTLNLTGPDVFRLFFGAKVDFSSFASVDHQYLKTALVHERTEDLTDALTRAGVLAHIRSEGLPAVPASLESDHGGDFLTRQQQRVNAACQDLLATFADRHLELFPGFDSRLRVYLTECDGRLLGVLMNPPENANNMITVRTLRLYQDALRLLRAWRLPLLSLLDTPGVDPRIDNSNQDVIQQLIETNRSIIHYPYPKMGVWSGRGFGGANTLVIPRCYGSFANYVILDRTRVGVMHESIIAHLLEKSKRMLALWQASRENETEDFSDLVEAGIVTRAIRLDEMGVVIAAFLRGEITTPEPEPLLEADNEEIYA